MSEVTCRICGESLPADFIMEHLRLFHAAENDAGHIDLAVDRDGNRYTTHTFGFAGAPWRGATILTPGVVRRLRERGLLPLTECPIPPGKGEDDDGEPEGIEVARITTADLAETVLPDAGCDVCGTA